MKTKIIKLLPIILLFLSGSVYSQNKWIIIGAEVDFYKPIGKLNERFIETSGTAFYAGIQTSERWTWLGKAEYYKFDKINKDELTINRKVQVDGVEQNIIFPLTGLMMDLEIAGISMNFNYQLFNFSFAEANLDAGFGIYKWKFSRSRFDTARADISSLTSERKTAYYAVNGISTSQEDFSGGFNAGIEFAIYPIQNFAVTVAGTYKNIIGEMYPALEFDMENVSTFQMADFKVGVRLKL